jgi:glycosyltransferase involved in cell wall biosynthesis
VILETRVVCGAGGGPDKTILNSPRYLDGNGYRTICAYMHPPSDVGFESLRRKAHIADAELVSIPDRGPWDWRVVTNLLNLCRRQRVRIWHGHDYKSNAIGLLVKRFWPMKLVTTVHGWVQHTTRTPLYYTIDRYCLPRYDLVICVSSDLHEAAIESGVPADRCVLIENAIDTDDFCRRTSVSQAKQNLGLSPDRIAVGAVGRLSAEKGFGLLIQAAAQLFAKGFDFDLLIAGEGDAEPQLRALIERLKVGDRVRLIGYRDDLRPFYEALDLFVLSSLREGLPNVLLEAMAMEVPVLSTRIAGVPRLIQDGENGVLVEPNSVEELVNGIERLLGDPAARRRVAANGRRTVEEKFSFASRMQKIKTIYDRLLSRNGTKNRGGA